MSLPIFRTTFSYGGKVNWFPSHMIRAHKKVIETLKNIDIVLELRDSRAPITSENPLLSDILKDNYNSFKSHVIIFNKADLSNHNLQKKITTLFEKRDRGISVAFTQSSSPKTHTSATQQPSHPRHPFTVVKTAISNHLEWVKKRKQELQKKEFGGEVVESTLSSTYVDTTKIDPSKMKKELNLMVVGLPNVGKSSLINAIRMACKMSKAARTGALPGVTKHISGFKIMDDPAAFLVDTPGIMIPGCMDNVEHALTLAAIGSIAERITDVRVVADFLLFRLNQLKQFSYVEELGLENGPTDNIQDIINHICTKKGYFQNTQNIQKEQNQQSSQHDDTQASKYFISLYREGKLGKFSLDTLPNNLIDLKINKSLKD